MRLHKTVVFILENLVEVEPVPGEFVLKGFLKPVQAYNVLGLRES
jgi:hypothetical protein